VFSNLRRKKLQVWIFRGHSIDVVGEKETEKNTLGRTTPEKLVLVVGEFKAI